MIKLTEVSARENKITVTQLTLELGAGASAVFGSPADGVALLLALIAGATRPSRGSARVLDRDPLSAAARRSIGYVPHAPNLPEALRVGQALSLMATLRGSTIDTAAALSRFGLSGLSETRVSELTAAQVRAVALAEAVASPAVRVLLVEEPFVSMEPSASAAMRAALTSDPQRCVVITTASLADARELASVHVMLSSGRITRVGTSNDLVDLSGPVKLVAIARDPRALVRALSKHESLIKIEVHGDTVIVTAAELETASRALNQAVVACGTSLDSLIAERA